MSDNEKRDTLPFRWIGRLPIYATTVLVMVELVGMFLVVFHATASSQGEWGTISTFGFSPWAFWKDWSLWQLVTYPWLNFPHFFFIVGLFFLYQFGLGLETFFGRPTYLKICVLLMLVPPLVKTIWWACGANTLPLHGNYELVIGIFVAYATLYPNVEQWNWITMKWLAFAGIVLASLMYFPRHDWQGLSVLWSTCAAAYALVRYERGQWTLPSLSLPSRRPKLRVLPKPSTPPRPMPKVEMDKTTADSEVDALLDKIAKSGIASLTPAEKARLEKAREELLKKERR